MPHPFVARTKFDLALVIEGTTYRCAEVSLNYYLNNIPMASATLAVGRHVHTLDPAAAHSSLFTKDAGTKLLQEAEIILIPTGDWEPLGDEWPEQATIFKGYVTGVGVRTMRGSIRATVQIIHWLADLNFSSSMSNQSHPANPADLSWKSCYIGEGQQTTTGTPHFVHQTVAIETFSPGAIKEDFWGECLHSFLWQLSDWDQIQALPGRGIGPAGSNAQAQKALAKIHGGENSTGESDDYVPLSLYMEGTFDHEVALAIEGYMMTELATSWWSTTIWNKLVNEFASAFMFAVVPQVEYAMIVPYIPGTRELWKTIKNTEYNYIDTVSVIPRPLQAVAIYSGVTSETSEGGTINVGQEVGIGGFFRPEKADQGMLYAIRPAGWMEQIPAFSENSSRTIFGDDHGAPVELPTIATSDAGTKRGNEHGHTPEEAAVGTKDLFDRLAHAVYVQEALRGRFGVLNGKLRFDIAPGSTVMVEGSADRFIGEDTLRPNLIGEVHRVTCHLNAEGSRAGTSFQLVHLRTEEENEKDATSIPQHPLYDQVFPGAPLSDDLAFRDENGDSEDEEEEEEDA